MTRLIDGDALERAIYEWMPKDQEAWMDSDIPPIENLVVSIMMTIQEQPTVDAVPVRHGKWIDHDDEGYVECPFCGSCTNSDGNIKELHYCFNCGARMEAE